MITFDHVSKTYDHVMVVRDVSFTVNEGEVFVLVGPSGCGKTTTLKMMNGLVPLTKGTITIQGKPLQQFQMNELRWNMGYVLQQIALFPHMTIEENIAIVPELKEWPKEKIQARVEELMNLVNLSYEKYRHRYPSELSGGQQQRIGVVRALAADPDILLMDEPFSALDPISRRALQEELLMIQQTIQKTIVFVTHDMEEAMKLADRICLLNDGEIEQIGTPYELLHEANNAFVQKFIHQKEWTIESFLEEVEQEHLPSIALTASIHELLEKLAQHEALRVIDEKEHVCGQVTRTYVYATISKALEGSGAR